MTKMTQEQFYSGVSFDARPDQQTKWQRLIKDLRDQEFSWDQIAAVLAAMRDSPYHQEWHIEG